MVGHVNVNFTSIIFIDIAFNIVMQRAREKVPEKYRKQWEAVQDQKAMDALYRAIYWSSQI